MNKKRLNLIGRKISFDAKGKHGIKEHIIGRIIQAIELGSGVMRFQIKIEGSEDLRWYDVTMRTKKDNVLPNAPKYYPCDNPVCKKINKRSRKTKTTAEFDCPRCGTVTIVSIGTHGEVR
jgi:predicted RNA-binding Zn-ribbon protein involved in translation (DUF1610 family)